MPQLHKGYRYFTNPDLLGGDLDLRLVPLEPSHFAQTDTSLNQRLWAAFPVNVWGAEELPDSKDAQLTANGLFKLMEAERGHMQAKVRALRIVCQVFGAGPWNTAVQRRAAADVPPLATVMERVNAKKDVINKLFASGEYRAAVQGYAGCLLDLMPWYASPLLFTAQHAFATGIVHLETALWNNLHISVLKAKDLPVMPRLDLSILAFEAVNWMRYAPAKALYKARFRYVKDHDEHEQLSRIPQARALNDVMRECAEEMISKNSDEWAHRYCVREHLCFSPRYLEKTRAWEREQARLQREERNPLDDLE